jgi:hypothetical protein
MFLGFFLEKMEIREIDAWTMILLKTLKVSNPNLAKNLRS